MENVLQQIWQHILLELAVDVAVGVVAAVAFGVVVERNSLVEAVLAAANNRIATVVVVAAVVADADDSLPSFQDLPMVEEVEEEPYPVEGGDSERWCWLVP